MKTITFLMIAFSTASVLSARAAYVGTNNTVIPSLPPRIVSNGFVFIDNEYIDAPYCISNHILTIFINGRMAQVVYDPGPPLVVTNLPTLPPGITSTTSLDDVVFNSFTALAEIYYETFHPDDCVSLIAQFYAGLPNVSNAMVDPTDGQAVLICMNNGECVSQWVGLTPPDEDINVLDTLTQYIDSFASTLGRGGALFFHSYAGGVGWSSRFGESVAERELPSMLLLRDKKQEITDPQERMEVQLDRMKQAGGDFLDISDANLLTNLVASPQLEQRIQEMILRAQEQEPEE